MANSNEYLEILCNASAVSKVNWWPKYIYHYTDISNAVSILKNGRIFSRNKAINLMANDNAGTEIIRQTGMEIKDYVRFYFRPKTPTQFHNEGFVPSNMRYQNSNVPVPIFFAFEAKDMLARENVQFSETSLASSHHTLTNKIDDFAKFDFSRIYSDGPYKDENLNLYRHAEVVIPHECDLSDLKFIWCRSNAEFVSLCHLLRENGIYDQYKDLIVVKESDNNIFYKNSIYISLVHLHDKGFDINIKNLSEFSRHDIFQMRLTLRVKIGSETFDKVLSTHEIYESLHFTFANDKVINTFKDLKKYTLEIYFDENLVFVDEYSQKEKVLDDLPY